MNDSTLYISMPQSTLVFSKTVHLEDIATLFCLDLDITNTVNKIELFTFQKSDTMQVITIMKIIELISTKLKNINISNIGSTETIVYYKNESSIKRGNSKVKALLLLIVAFFGTGYSIMSYNGDVGTSDLLNKLFTLFTSLNPVDYPKESTLGILAYSIGLCTGMIIFFNHGFSKNSKNDPTPLQVQMRQYEKTVNACIITDSERKGKTIDIH